MTERLVDGLDMNFMVLGRLPTWQFRVDGRIIRDFNWNGACFREIKCCLSSVSGNRAVTISCDPEAVSRVTDGTLRHQAAGKIIHRRPLRAG